MTEIGTDLEEPGPLLVLTHPDPTPSNVVLVDGTARLVDFEGAAFRHLGLDASILRFPFPYYGRWALVPESACQEMESEYRRHVALDDNTYVHAIAVGCAAHAILRTHRLPRIDDPNQEPAVAFRRRVQIVHTIETFIDAAHRADAFRDLAGWFDDMVAAMRSRWPEANEPAPLFAAFR